MYGGQFEFFLLLNLSIIFSELLVAGCKSGKLYFWKYQPNSKHTTLTTADEYDLKSDWLLEKTVDSSSHSPNDEDGERPVNVKSVHWCENHSYLAALASSGVTIYEQAEAATAYHSEVGRFKLFGFSGSSKCRYLVVGWLEIT